MPVRIITGDCRHALRGLADESVHCVVTSPPYFGLRDYNVDGQIGLEASPAEFIEAMVVVFREVRRVLRADGTLWLNLGDSYAGSGRGSEGDKVGLRGSRRNQVESRRALIASRRRDDAPVPRSYRRHEGFKVKDLMMMPARVAMALQEDGWYLRQDIIWSKPNPMPESVRDRCTKSHEHIFLLSKAPFYYFDAEAIAEPVSETTVERLSQSNLANQKGSERVPNKTNGTMKAVGDSMFRNRRSVWEITTKPFTEAHFATFPPELPEICIKAGCPRGGGSPRSVRRRRHYRPRGRPLAARRHPHRAQPGICRHGRTPYPWRIPYVC